MVLIFFFSFTDFFPLPPPPYVCFLFVLVFVFFPLYVLFVFGYSSSIFFILIFLVDFTGARREWSLWGWVSATEKSEHGTQLPVGAELLLCFFRCLLLIIMGSYSLQTNPAVKSAVKSVSSIALLTFFFYIYTFSNI